MQPAPKCEAGMGGLRGQGRQPTGDIHSSKQLMHRLLVCWGVALATDSILPSQCLRFRRMAACLLRGSSSEPSSLTPCQFQGSCFSGIDALDVSLFGRVSACPCAIITSTHGVLTICPFSRLCRPDPFPNWNAFQPLASWAKMDHGAKAR